MKKITYGFSQTPFGLCLLAKTSNGICHLSFPEKNKQAATLNDLKKAWPLYSFEENKEEIARLVQDIFENKKQPPLTLEGTPFQRKVWQTLARIPFGTTVSYSDVAAMIDQPTAVRAVASAIANNEISFLIPCHRVITKSGKIHKYRWGSDVKKRILEWECQNAS